MDQLKVTSVSLTEDQIAYTKTKGNTSRYIRSLIDREMGKEQATERCQSLVRAYQNVLGRKNPDIPRGDTGALPNITQPST